MRFEVGSFSPWVAPLVSSISLVLGAFFLIELSEEKKKKHGAWVFIVVLCVGVISLVLAWAQIAQAERERKKLVAQADQDKKSLEAINQYRQARIDALNVEVTNLRHELAQNPVLHPKPQPPITQDSTFVEPLQEPGYPRTVHLTIRNTTDAIIPVRIRRLAVYVKLLKTYASMTDEEEENIENAAYDGLMSRPLTPEKDLATGNGGTFDISLSSDPLSAENLGDLQTGRALLFFLFQARDASSGYRLIDACVLLTPQGEVKNCTHHNRYGA